MPDSGKLQHCPQAQDCRWSLGIITCSAGLFTLHCNWGCEQRESSLEGQQHWTDHMDWGSLPEPKVRQVLQIARVAFVWFLEFSSKYSKADVSGPHRVTTMLTWIRGPIWPQMYICGMRCGVNVSLRDPVTLPIQGLPNPPLFISTAILLPWLPLKNIQWFRIWGSIDCLPWCNAQV